MHPAETQTTNETFSMGEIRVKTAVQIISILNYVGKDRQMKVPHSGPIAGCAATT